jgi:hypothetical protein
MVVLAVVVARVLVILDRAQAAQEILQALRRVKAVMVGQE